MWFQPNGPGPLFGLVVVLGSVSYTWVCEWVCMCLYVCVCVCVCALHYSGLKWPPFFFYNNPNGIHTLTELTSCLNQAQYPITKSTHWAHTGWIKIVSTSFHWNYVEPTLYRCWMCPVGKGLTNVLEDMILFLLGQTEPLGLYRKARSVILQATSGGRSYEGAQTRRDVLGLRSGGCRQTHRHTVCVL